MAAPFAFGANASMPYGDAPLVKTYVVPDVGAGPEVGVGVGVGVGEAVGVGVGEAVGVGVGEAVGVGVGEAVAEGAAVGGATRTRGATPPPPQLASNAPQQQRGNKNPGTFNRRLMPPV